MQTQSEGYSARVSLTLLFGGHTIQLGQLLPGTCIAQEIPRTLPPGSGEIVVRADGNRRVLPVYLPGGVTSKVIDFSRYCDQEVPF
jgi:hypothetical protein